MGRGRGWSKVGGRGELVGLSRTHDYFVVLRLNLNVTLMEQAERAAKGVLSSPCFHGAELAERAQGFALGGLRTPPTAQRET